MENNLQENGKTKEKELDPLLKAKAVTMRLRGYNFQEISRELNCEEEAVEEYLSDLKLTEETLSLLHNKKISSQRISDECGIPINLVDGWRNIIFVNKQNIKAEHRKVREVSAKKAAQKMDSERSAMLKSLKIEPQPRDEKKEQEMDSLSQKLIEEMTDESILSIKEKITELHTIPRTLVDRVIRKTNLSLERAMTITENASKLGVPNASVVQSVISKFIQQKDFVTAKEYLHTYSSDFDLRKRNQLISDIRAAEKGEER